MFIELRQLGPLFRTRNTTCCCAPRQVHVRGDARGRLHAGPRTDRRQECDGTRPGLLTHGRPRVGQRAFRRAAAHGRRPGPSFAYSLPVHAFHTRRDRVASLTACQLHGAAIQRASPLGPGRALTLPCGWNNAGMARQEPVLRGGAEGAQGAGLREPFRQHAGLQRPRASELHLRLHEPGREDGKPAFLWEAEISTGGP